MIKRIIMALMLVSSLNAMNTDINLKILNKKELINRLISKDSSLNIDTLNKQTKASILKEFKASKLKDVVVITSEPKKVIPIAIKPKVEIPVEVALEIDKVTTKRRFRPITIGLSTTTLSILSLAVYLYFNKFELIEPIIEPIIKPVVKVVENGWFNNIVDYFTENNFANDLIDNSAFLRFFMEN